MTVDYLKCIIKMSDQYLFLVNCDFVRHSKGKYLGFMPEVFSFLLKKI